MAFQGNSSRSWLVLIIVVLCTTLSNCSGESSKQKFPISTTPGGEVDPILVKKLYDAKCALCHGFDGHQQYGGAKDLGLCTMNKDEIIKQIAEGKGAMPPQKDVLSQEQIEALADFVMEFRPK